MHRQNELQNFGQEQYSSRAHCASQAASSKQCIPIKRRWLEKFDTAEGNANHKFQDKIGFPVVDVERPSKNFSCPNQTEALDLSKHRKVPSGSLATSQASPNRARELGAANRTVLKRGSDTPGFLDESGLKRSKHSSLTLHTQQLRGTSYQLPSSVSNRDSFGKLLHEPSYFDTRRCQEDTDKPRLASKWDIDDQWESSRQHHNRSKTILEQCLSGVLDSLPVRPTVENVLRYQDHTKLSIGLRTELDKLHDEELLEKYLEGACGIKHAHDMPPSRLKSMISAMFYDQDSLRDECDGLGSTKFPNSDSFGHSYSANATNGHVHQPIQSQNGIYRNSTMSQDMDRMGGELSTISVSDLFVPAVAQHGDISGHQNSLHTTGQLNSFQQIGNGSVLNGESLPRNVELTITKEERSDHLPSCQRPKAQCTGIFAQVNVEKAEYTVERLDREERNVTVKSEADTCSLLEDEPISSEPALTTRKAPNPQATATKPADGKCPICTDVVSGYHYGTHSCESCKGFFKRTIQNKRNERLACALEGRCVINLQNRKHCASCRFKKCLDSGMKQEAVREDRQRGGRSMYDGSSEQRRRQHLQIQQQQKEALGQVKKRKPRKRAPSTATQPPKEDQEEQPVDVARMPPQSSGSSSTLSDPSKPSTSNRNQSNESCVELDLYGQKLEVLEATFFNPFGLPRISIDRSDCEKSLLNAAYYLLDHFCKKLPTWIEMMPLLQDVEVFDQSVLLKANWLQVLILTVCYRCHDSSGHLILPDRTSCDMVAVVNSVAVLDIVRRLKQLAQTFQALKTTREEYYYLKLLILLNPDVKNLSQPSRICGYQEKVQEQLFEFGIAKEGVSASMKIGELLLKLSELERLSHLIKEHLVFTQVAGQLGSRKYSNLENMLQDY